jgi:hypothetical protein
MEYTDDKSNKSVNGSLKEMASQEYSSSQLITFQYLVSTKDSKESAP